MKKLISGKDKLDRAEELLVQFCDVFHEIEGETQKDIDPRIDKIWKRVTDYFQGGVSFSLEEEEKMRCRDIALEMRYGIK